MAETSSSQPRLFWAAEIGAAAEAEMTRLQGRLREAAPEARIRWVKAEQAGFHITLQFLGASPPIGEVASAGEPLRSLPPLRFRLGRLGSFGGRRPSILWCGVDNDGQDGLARLAAATNAAMEPLGFAPDERGYTPHITLGRAARRSREGGGKEALARLGEAIVRLDVEPATILVEEAVLFESEQARGGPRYVPRARLRLQGEPPK